MRIGIDARLIGKKRTGDEAVFFNLIKNLSLIDSQNEYRLFTNKTSTPILHYMGVSLGVENKDNFEIVSLPTKNRFSWNFWTLPRYLRAHPVDIYLTQYITPWFVSKKIKIITIIHDISFKIFPQFIKKSDLFFLNFLIPLSLKRADKIIAVSRFTASEIIKHYKVNSKKVAWIHNAVAQDLLAKNVSKEKMATVRKKYGLPKRYILYLGTLQPRKNIPVLLKAFTEIKKCSDIKLVIAGGKGHNYDTRIDEEIRKNKLDQSVILTGFITEDDKLVVMAGAEIFVFPSLYEGFGIPILEAMSVGVPVVASAISPHKEVAGEATLFFNPKSSQDLAKKLRELIRNENLRQNLIRKGEKRVREFSWKKSARKVLKIFKDLRSDIKTIDKTP